MDTQVTYNYEYQAIKGIPEAMIPWGIQLNHPVPSSFGEYVLVEMTPAYIELHHQVELVDEVGEPLRGVWVIFGFPGGKGPQINLMPRENHWPGGGRSVLIGNAQKTNAMGYAQHTFASGGEDIFVWDVDKEGVLKLPSPIVAGCKWVGTGVQGAPFIHTGVRLVFQRRMTGVPTKSIRHRLDELEAELQAQRASNSEDRLVPLEERLKAIEQQMLKLENLELRIKLLEK